MYFHKSQEKPHRWGSFQDVQYAVMENCEKIYGVDPDSLVLAMPLFWGLPLLDYSRNNVSSGVNSGIAPYQDGGIYMQNANPTNTILSSMEELETDRTTLTYVHKYSSTVNYNGIYICASAINNYLQFNNIDKDIDLSIYNTATHGYKGSFGSWSPGKNYMIGAIEDATNNLGYGVLNSEKYDLVKNGQGFAQAGRWTGGDIVFGRRHWTTTYGLDGLLLSVLIIKSVLTAEQVALFHDRPRALYWPVSRPVYFFQAAGGGGVSVDANVVNLTLTEYTAGINAETNVQVGIDALVLTEQAADVNLDVSVQTAFASLTLTENVATVNAEINVQAGIDTLVLTALQASVEVGGSVEVFADTVALTLTEQTATVNAEVNVQAITDTLVLTANQAGVNAETNVNVSIDSLTLSALAAQINAENNILAVCDDLVLAAYFANISDGQESPFTVRCYSLPEDPLMEIIC